MDANTTPAAPLFTYERMISNTARIVQLRGKWYLDRLTLGCWVVVLEAKTKAALVDGMAHSLQET